MWGQFDEPLDGAVVDDLPEGAVLAELPDAVVVADEALVDAGVEEVELLVVALATAACIYWAYAWQGYDPVCEAIFGGVLILFAMIDGFHISNILTFHWILRHPDQVTGEVFMTQRYVVHLTRCRTVAVLFPIAVAAALAPSPFLFGGIASVFSLILGQSVWGWRDARREKRAAVGQSTSNS